MQRKRCVCPCGELDPVRLSNEACERVAADRTFGWARWQRTEFEERIDGLIRTSSRFIARQHFAPGDMIVRGVGLPRLLSEHGLGMASRGFVAGRVPGAAGRFTPSAVPMLTPQTSDRVVPKSADARFAALDDSAHVLDARHETEAVTSLGRSAQREVEALTEALEQSRQVRAPKAPPPRLEGSTHKIHFFLSPLLV